MTQGSTFGGRGHDGSGATLSEVDNLPAHHGYRVSDADREKVAELLREAAGEGRLEIHELEERLERAYAAKTYGDLEPVTQDLPASGSVGQDPVQPHRGAQWTRVGGTPTGSTAIAIFAGSDRRGAWVVPPQFSAFAMFGGVNLDLREAQLTEREVTITAVAIMGGVDITVPDDCAVVVDGAGIFGGFDESVKRGIAPAPPGSPVVRIRGLAVMGGVTVKRRPPKREFFKRLGKPL
jgi:DUF1707 SHOCT-like domain/Cell wall-active antibiotics response LiaF, C-terminal